jgi:hypothetical protein
MSIPVGNGATGAPGTGPALGYLLNLLWFKSWFMLISKNNMNTCTYLIHTLSLIYIMKLLVIFGIKIYQKLPSCLTMDSEEGRELRARVAARREEAVAALEDGGTSQVALARFLADAEKLRGQLGD